MKNITFVILTLLICLLISSGSGAQAIRYVKSTVVLTNGRVPYSSGSQPLQMLPRFASGDVGS